MTDNELHANIRDRASDDGTYAIAYALLELAYHVKYLGNGNAATQMGALEAFGLHLGEKLDALADALRERQE
jgi:hypothetical protein